MLIASSSAEENLLKIAKEYWHSPSIYFENGKVFNSKGVIEGVAVEKHNKRYRLVSSVI